MYFIKTPQCKTNKHCAFTATQNIFCAVPKQVKIETSSHKKISVLVKQNVSSIKPFGFRKKATTHEIHKV